jgi:CHAD domain-containing protein
MAKARDIPGLDAWMPFAEAAAATVTVRAEELFEQSEHVLDITDIERVHDMRVASRRLRAVLEIYAPCFPPDEFKPILREVKALADALGARRDPDVLLDQLAKLEGTLPKADAPGIEAFAAPVHIEQAHGNEILAAALDHAERTDLRGRLALLAARAVAPEEAEDAAPPDIAPVAAAPVEAVVAAVDRAVVAPATAVPEPPVNANGSTAEGATP